jgi:hypothetical protein
MMCKKGSRSAWKVSIMSIHEEAGVATSVEMARQRPSNLAGKVSGTAMAAETVAVTAGTMATFVDWQHLIQTVAVVTFRRRYMTQVCLKLGGQEVMGIRLMCMRTSPQMMRLDMQEI